MGEKFELMVSVLVIIGLVVSICVVILSKLVEYFFAIDDKEPYNDIVEDHIPVKQTNEEKQQSPLPATTKKVDNTELEITNIKDSVVVTETVYAD